jgi:hypothetical protein
MAHARRYFVEAKILAPKECKHVIHLIGRLYKIERDLKKARKDLTPEKCYKKRFKTRQQLSVKILEELREYLIMIKSRYFLEQHPLYKAIHYMLNRYELFCEYTRDGRFEIDNNAIENMIRPIAIGRRNWLFAGSEHGARMAAVMMTVVQTCRRLKINPQRYLADVLPRLADQNTNSLEGLTPMEWAAAH